MTVQGDSLLSSTSFAYSQRYTQDGIGTKFGCNRKKVLQECYVFMKRLRNTSTTVLVMAVHSICHALPNVSDKVT